ncbi:hypothetical protein EU545_02660 [Candidatus Thorarchaeota archaeon]|nr:MAG: hypothetical protein EU545_02660 [Candidatus Thorarchaeota archaeon]
MIRLIGVLTQGGVPIKVQSSVDTEGDLIVGPLIEATKALSQVMGSGEVKRLAFRDNTLIVTESDKGYTVVALVGKAEDYMNSLLRVIAEAIDDSGLPPADGSVVDVHKTVVEDIISPYVRSHVEGSFPDIFETIWTPLLDRFMEDEQYADAIREIESLVASEPSFNQWNQIRANATGTLADALQLAQEGVFDRACAVAMQHETPSARIFAVKMGALTHSMTKTAAPPLASLRDLANGLPREHPFTDFAKILVEYNAGNAIPADYSRVFRDAVNKFEFVNDEEHLMLGFLFLDPRIVEYGDFHKQMAGFYEGKSRVFGAFIDAIEERGKIFDKLYSVTSYDGFKDELGVYKARITSILGNLNWVIDPSLYDELAKEGKAIEIGVSASLSLQNYIALLTALAESPVLTISERKARLNEVLMLYRDYFTGLLKSDVPLFAYNLDSIFQSLSVAHAEYYFLSTGSEREKHLKETAEFLSDIYDVVESEWAKARVRFSLFVVLNAICPILARGHSFGIDEIRLAYLASRLQDVETIDATQITRPMNYATEVGNTVNALTALGLRAFDEKQGAELLMRSMETSLDVFEWFLSHGVICRDDIVSGTYHLTQVARFLDDDTLERFVTRTIALNRIVIQDPEKYDYELAMMAGPLLDLLSIAHRRFSEERYGEIARGMYLLALEAWRKYGFEEKADNFREKYSWLE